MIFFSTVLRPALRLCSAYMFRHVLQWQTIRTNRFVRSFDVRIFRESTIDTFASKWQRQVRATMLTHWLFESSPPLITNSWLGFVVLSAKLVNKPQHTNAHILTYAQFRCVWWFFSFCQWSMTPCLVAVRKFNDKQVLFIFIYFLCVFRIDDSKISKALKDW